MLELIVLGAFLLLFVVPMVCVGAIVWHEIGRPTWQLMAKEIRKRRYSVGTLFSGIAVFAITFAMIRILSPNDNTTLALAAIIAFVIALGVVAMVCIVRSDFSELYCRRGTRSEESSSGSPELIENCTAQFSELPLIRTSEGESADLPDRQMATVASEAEIPSISHE